MESVWFNYLFDFDILVTLVLGKAPYCVESCPNQSRWAQSKTSIFLLSFSPLFFFRPCLSFTLKHAECLLVASLSTTKSQKQNVCLVLLLILPESTFRLLILGDTRPGGWWGGSVLSIT